MPKAWKHEIGKIRAESQYRKNGDVEFNSIKFDFNG